MRFFEVVGADARILFEERARCSPHPVVCAEAQAGLKHSHIKIFMM